ncbi:peroxiredoxin [Lysobacter helvus]|uniref:Glutathione-dependent peroxiredoxin n=2 Tax=Lysobacteraceae TaxID=32033 RepID=A0ABM7Q9H0_9GAMM|nr:MULTISPECIES: peroxiredoxin [Lysobacter]BCT94021.1 peroxiredoxin [Lysobacter caseinilyticus]BCT97177.1 peroxiredoxin [Lysobacter helvus]
MTIQPGDRLPEIPLQRIREGVETVDVHTLFGGKQVVLFAVPGAFTPTCSERHLPGFVEKFDAFRQRGVEVLCLSVNDPFVMKAWGESQHVPEGLQMLADGNGEFTRALGLEMDASGYGMGTRARRFAMFVDDGVVKQLHVEAPGEFRVSSAEYVLDNLPA